MTTVNYTETFKRCYGLDETILVAQGKDTNFLALQQLEEPFKRFDGKKGYYALEYRWLSEHCEHKEDEAFACVQGAEYIYLTKREAKNVLLELKNKPEEFSLFNHLNLF